MKKNLFACLIFATLFAVPAGAYAQSCAPKFPVAQLQVGESYLVFRNGSGNTKPICVKNAGNLVIHVKPVAGYHKTLKAGDVSVSAKDNTTGLGFKGQHPVPDMVIVELTGSGTVGQTYGFNIHVKGVGQLDPMVEIIPENISPLAPSLDLINQYLEEGLGLSLGDLGVTDEDVQKALENKNAAQ